MLPPANVVAAAIASRTRSRCLHYVRVLLSPAKRRCDEPLDYRPTGVPHFDEYLDELFGNPHAPHIPGIAPTRKEGALVHDSVLLDDLLARLRNELPRLKETLKPEPFEPEHDDGERQYLSFEYYDFHRKPASKYDPTPPPAVASACVVLRVDLARLVEVEGLSPRQTHLLRLLTSEHRDADVEMEAPRIGKPGPRSNDNYVAQPGLLPRTYDPLTNTLRIACKRYAYRAQNKRWLGDMLNRLVSHVKAASDCFEDVPLNFTYADAALRRREEARLYLQSTFPPEWASKRVEDVTTPSVVS